MINPLAYSCLQTGAAIAETSILLITKDKVKLMNDDTQTVNDTAIAKAIDDNAFDLSTLTPENQLAYIQDIIAAEAALEAAGLPSYTSKEIVGQEFNIIDAAFTTIMDKDEQKVCVRFVLQGVGGAHDNELFTVLKGSNSFNDLYVNLFTRTRGITKRILLGFEFVVDPRYTKANNPAIVLRRIPQAIPATKGK